MIQKLKGTLFRVGISLLSLGLVLYVARGKFTDALAHLTNLNWSMVALALTIQLGTLVIVSFRLQLVLAVQGVIIPVVRLYYLWLLSLFFNLFLPSAVGGDIGKAYYIYKDSGKKLASVSSVLMDRFVGLMATITLGCLAYLGARDEIQNPQIGYALICFVGIVIGGVFFVMNKWVANVVKQIFFRFFPARFQPKIHQFFDAFDLYRVRRKSFFIAYGYSILAQGFFICIFYLLARAIGVFLPLGVFFLLIPLVTLCSMIPSIGGLGVREASTVYLFRSYMAVEEAVALSLLAALFIYGFGALCGILYAFRGGGSLKEIEEVEEPEKI